jgi:hypothetical protein
LLPSSAKLDSRASSYIASSDIADNNLDLHLLTAELIDGILSDELQDIQDSNAKPNSESITTSDIYIRELSDNAAETKDVRVLSEPRPV